MNDKIMFVSILIFVASIFLGYGISLYRDESIKKDGIIQELRNSQRVMIWKMDDSCYNQIQNSQDGMIRLKITK